MLVTLCRLAFLLSRLPGPPDPEAWPTGSLSRAPFAGRQAEAVPVDPGGDGSPFFVSGVFDRRMDLPVRNSFPEDLFFPAPSGTARLKLPAESPALQDFQPPHDTLEGYFRRHGSSDAWHEDVWKGYLTQTEVLLPIGLAVSAAAIYRWDRTLEQHWQGVLGGHQTLGNIGAYTILGASLLIGVLMPGEGRNSWDEFWTQAETFAVTTLSTTVLKYGVARYRPGHGAYSFPSGHAAIAFAGATLIERNSGAALGIPAYALAAFTGFERIEAGRHYPSDVLAGAAIGSFSAGIFDALHWGSGPEGGGIARRPVTCRVDMDGLRSGVLEIAFGF